MINRETPLVEIVGQMSLSRCTDVSYMGSEDNTNFQLIPLQKLHTHATYYHKSACMQYLLHIIIAIGLM